MQNTHHLCRCECNGFRNTTHHFHWTPLNRLECHDSRAYVNKENKNASIQEVQQLKSSLIMYITESLLCPVGFAIFNVRMI